MPLLALFLLAFFAFGAAPQAIAQPEAKTTQAKVSEAKEGENDLILGSFGTFVFHNKDVIEPLGALVGGIAGVFLCVVTGFLVAGTFRLANSTDTLAKGADAQAAEQRRANDIASDANELTKRQIGISKRAETLGEMQFHLAEKQFALAGKSAKTADLANEIALKSYDEAVKEHKVSWHTWVAANRPVIRVMSVQTPPIDNGQPFSAVVQITNLGEADATLQEVWSDVGRIDSKGVWMNPAPQFIDTPIPTTVIVKCGDRPFLGVRSRQPLDGIAMAANTFNSFARDDFPALRLLGEIVYRDPAGSVRRTGFMFLWNVQSERWEENTPPDPQYQYEY